MFFTTKYKSFHLTGMFQLFISVLCLFLFMLYRLDVKAHDAGVLVAALNCVFNLMGLDSRLAMGIRR
jgi:hypothetical protein